MTRCTKCQTRLPLIAGMRGAKICKSCGMELQELLDRMLGPRDWSIPPPPPDDGFRISLPEYPAETDPNCTCSWVITDANDRTEATWKLDDANPCTNKRCRDNATRWNPLVLR
jgi:hypothetical protein